MSPSASRTAPWKGPVSVCAVLGAILLLYWPGVVSLAQLWSDTRGETYTSGFLIAAISLWLLWRARAQLVPGAQPLPTRWRVLGLVFLAGTALVWQFAYRASIQLGYLTLLPVLMWTCLAVGCGWRAARAAIFPLGFLIFALPLWDYLIPLLQWFTILVVRLALRATGVPSYFNGDFVQIPAGVFEIQGGCSGLHFFIVGFAIAALLGELRRDDLRTRLRWVLLATALAIFSNWLRVYTIILAGHLSHMQSYLVRVSHYSYGWALFMGTLLVFFLYVRWCAPAPRQRTTQPSANRDAPPLGGTLQPAWLMGALTLAAVPAMLNLIIAARLPAASGLLVATPPALGGSWRASAAPDSDWQPLQAGADQERHWRLTRAGQVIELYAAGYVEQRQRKKLGGRANLPGGLGVEVLDEGSRQAGGKTFATQQLEHDGMTARLWRVYQVADRWFVSATRAQFWYSARTFATLRSPPSRVWMLRTDCATDCTAAEAMLGRFVEENGDVLWPESP